LIPVPRFRLILLLTVPLVFFIIDLFIRSFGVFGLYLNAIIFSVLIFDYLYSLFTVKITFIVKKSPLFSIGRENTIELEIKNISNTTIGFNIELDLPEYIENLNKSETHVVQSKRQKNIEILIFPKRRGSYEISILYFRFISLTRFFYLLKKYNTKFNIDVYPDIKGLNYFLKLTRTNRDYQLGIYQNRYIGMGTEVSHLRDYQKDDDSKNIDWKASARLNRPISKVYQTETKNYITIAIDCGRLITAEQNGMSSLDYAVNSLLILTHIAFRAGDSVSVIAYSDRIIEYLPPVKGKAGLNSITKCINRLQPEFVESNYNLVFNYLNKKVNRRSLIIFLTDMIDDINLTLFTGRISILSKTHLVLFILLRDIILNQVANMSTNVSSDLGLISASREMYLHRKNAVENMRSHKIDVIDILPHELTGPLINKYLMIKSRNRL
jgi:uncharacterized protein (DUF58 family)